MTIPKTVDDLTPAWLSDALGRKVVDPNIEMIGVGVGLVGSLCRVSFDGETIVAKLAAATEENRFVPAMLNFYGREFGFYTQLSERTPIKHPKCFYAAHDPETQDTVLLLEDAAAYGECRDQIAGCTLEAARPALATVARLHAHYWEDASLAELDFLPKLCDEPYPSAVPFAYDMAWPVIQDLYADLVDARLKEFGDRYSAQIAPIFDRLCDGPLTLSHGDWRVDNLFFTRENDVLAVNWQIIDRSVGPRDIAYLITQSVNIDDPAGYRVAFDEYVADLATLGVDVDRSWAWEQYRVGALLGFVYPVVAGGGLGVDDPRGLELCGRMLQ
ncbi:MAG TPA: hypothetical protein VNC41_00820, partial [Acidimicrobiia bacterium]|nr:hypothetical protein [Acidimicrobiia bacterium]